MNARVAVLVLIPLLTGGCPGGFDPELHVIAGAVHYRAGGLVNHARVWSPGGATTFCDALGHFRIVVRSGVDTVLCARNGYEPGLVFSWTCGGCVRLDPSGSWERKDIVLTDCSEY